MKTISINLYAFNELSETAKEKALQTLSDINVDFGWWDFIYEDAKEIGLDLSGFDLHRDIKCEGEFILDAKEVAQNIVNNHGEKTDTFFAAFNFLDYVEPLLADYMNEDSYRYENIHLGNEIMNLETSFLNKLLKLYFTILQS